MDRIAGKGMAAAPAVGTAAALVAIVLFAAGCGAGPEAGSSNVRPGAAWYLSALGVPAIPSAAMGRGQLIAVLDSGLNSADLPTLRSRVVQPWNQMTSQPGAFDDNGHGTEIALVAAGGGDLGVWGLASGAEVMPIKVADADGQANPNVVAAAIRRAVNLHASVINLSLATEVPNAAISSAIATAIGSGVVVVAAAGDASEIGPQFPASVPGVVAVYGQDRSGLVVAQFNQPTGPAALAPGVDVDTLAASPAGLAPKRVSGTSVAGAMISGLLADCLSAQARAAVQLRRSIQVCESRMIRSPEAPGFLNLNTVLQVSA